MNDTPVTPPASEHCPNEHAPGEPIACWNPGGPCETTMCELCGPCLRCQPATGHWHIYLPDGVTKATLSAYLSEEGARAAIERWRTRQTQGGRPDCTLDLDEMVVRRG